MTRVRGLTLVELVLTISITLILTAVAVGGVVGIGAWRAASAVRSIHADVQYARALAVMSGCRTAVTIDTGNQSYTLGKETQPATGKLAVAPLDHPMNDGAWAVPLSELGGGLQITGVKGLSNDVLGFGADGLPLTSSGSRVTKTARIELSNGAYIELDAGSGRSEVHWP